MKRAIAALLVMVLVLTLCSCASPEKAIVGTWKSQNTVLGVVTETKYVFNEDGTGTMTNIIDIGFTYAFVDEKLVITTETLGIQSSTEYTYQFDGSKLTLRNDNDTINLEKAE